jgi:hypothetical protein
MDEDATHVWKCRGSGSDEVWDKAMANFKHELVKAFTLPDLAEVMCDRLTSWRNDVEPSTQASSFLGLRATIDAQDRVGWQAMLEGLPVHGWAEVQHRYLVWRKKRRTGKRWLASIIQKLWDVAWDLWDHRNRILHDTDTNLAAQQQRREIEEEYSRGNSTVTQEAKRLFRPGLAQLLALPPAGMQAWLIRIRSARLRFAELATTQQPFTAERRGMAQWLKRGEDEIARHHQ